MYGLVNQGIEKLVVDNHGQGAWDKICDDAGIPKAEFQSIVNYDDEITYKLVAAISENLGADAADVLRLFGGFWPNFARNTAIGRLFEFGGETFTDFLESLDEMHDRMIMSLPELRPPSFDVEFITDDQLLLHYHSDRNGLAPMVVGLLHGLALEFGQKIAVQHQARKDAGSDHDIFLVDLLEVEASDSAAA